MTTTYSSKEEALMIGAGYCGYETRADIEKVLREAEVSEQEIGNPLISLLPPEEASKYMKKIDVYTISTKDGRKISLGVGNFREGFDLWLIDPATGRSLRT